jgi:predicted transcriptional regulator
MVAKDDKAAKPKSKDARPKSKDVKPKSLPKHTYEPMTLGELREHFDIRQGDMAETMGMRQPSLCKLERRSNVQVASIKKFAEALEGELEVSVVIGDSRYIVRFED